MPRFLLLAIGVFFYLAGSAQIQINGSYLNITRPSGGPVATGDVLELRAVISIPSGTTLTALSYTDNVPTGSTFVSGSLKVVTNENLVVPAIPNTGNYTDAPGDDRGSISGSAITIYMGTGATSSAGGSVTGGSTTPVFQSSATILMVAYQVTVAVASGSTITTAGAFNYKNGSTTTSTNVTPTTFVISPYYGCNGSGSNLLTAETNGTFSSGTNLNRNTSANVTGYGFKNLTTTAPADGNYSIVKNSSPTQYTGASPASSDKVWGVWDILGDHTGTSTAAGNPPSANGANGGYFLIINGTYTPATVFNVSITGLTGKAIYTVTFWVRNICGSCGNNPATGAALTTPGVKPNLAINVNGRNYYSSGEIAYTGQWEQKSFTFQNGTSTAATIDIKNNAPGGGGNDWALDDITVTPCLIVLPLGLQSFSGHTASQGSILDWKIQPTPELRSFVIERSTDGTHFLPVGEQSAMKDTDDYQFTDPLLSSASATLFYRIRLVTFDDNTFYSNVITLRTDGGTGALTTRVAPNPAKSRTTLLVQSARAGQARISLMSPTGGLLSTRWSTLMTGVNAIDLTLPDHLPKGIYLVRTTSGNESSLSRLIVE